MHWSYPFRFFAIALLAAALTACDSGNGNQPAASNNDDAADTADAADNGAAAEPQLTEAQRKEKAQQAYERGLQLLVERQPQDAAHAFDEAIRFDDTHAAAHVERGKLQVEYGDLDRGGNDLYRAVELNPDLESAYIALALFHEKKFEQTGNEADKHASQENLRIARKIRGEPEPEPTQVDDALNSILKNTLPKANDTPQ